jgi:hypothetical protein
LYVKIRFENLLCGSGERRRREIDGTFLFWGVASDFAATVSQKKGESCGSISPIFSFALVGGLKFFSTIYCEK